MSKFKFLIIVLALLVSGCGTTSTTLPGSSTGSSTGSAYIKNSTSYTLYNVSLGGQSTSSLSSGASIFYTNITQGSYQLYFTIKVGTKSTRLYTDDAYYVRAGQTASITMLNSTMTIAL